MRLWQLILVTILTHAAFVGSRMLISLYAIHLHASTFTVGLLMTCYALLPMLFAVGAGRMVDRIGARWPMFGAAAAVSLGLLLSFAWPRLEMLYVAATLIGAGFMMFHVSVSQVVGAIGQAEDRAANFSWLAMGFSVSGSIGPLVTGFAIDSIGHARTFALLFLFPLIPMVMFWLNRPALPPAKESRTDALETRLMDLLRISALRRVFIASGMLNMAWDMYIFVVPIYGSRIGLSASTIGIVMGSFAIATFAVRALLPLLIRRVQPWQVITVALAISAAVYCLIPLFTSVPLLVALSCALGVGLGCSQPMVMTLLYNTSPPGRQGEALGVRTTVMNASHALLPFAFGALGAALGMFPVFWAMAVLLGAGSYFVRRRRDS